MPDLLHELDRDPEQDPNPAPLTVTCPQCGAKPGDPCTGHPGLHWLSHSTRYAILPFTARERAALIADPYTDLLPYEGTDL